MKRIVLDTNIFISSLISKKGSPYWLYYGWKEKLFCLITSNEQLEEIERVLQYPKLNKFIDKNKAKTLIDGLFNLAIIVHDLPKVNYSLDPDDNLIIATAIKGKADFLVTGDKGDLLILKNVENISIITASQAIEVIGIKKRES